MNRYLASSAVLLCFASATFLGAQDNKPVAATVKTVVSAPAEAKIVLSAPSVARIGELVRLDVSESVADSFKWLLVPQTQDWLTYDNGARAVFSARTPGDYQFVVACAKNGAVDVVTHIVRVLGPPQEPQGDNLSEWIPYWNWELALPKDELLAMAASFEEIAERADELEAPAGFIKATATANREVLGDRLEAWKPMLDKIGANLKTKAELGALGTADECKTQWMDIARGLKACCE